MKASHALAAALTGWYLLLPPIVCRNRTAIQTGNVAVVPSPCQYDASAPLSAWRERNVFDSAQSCQVDREGFLFAPDVAYLRAVGMTALCVADDDPRLR